MRRTIRPFALLAVLGLLAVPALAQDQCTDENKSSWYQTFLDNYKGDADKQKVAYEAATKYVKSCPADQYSEYMNKKFIEPYEAIRDTQAVAAQFQEAVNKKNFPDQFRLGRQILSKDANNPAVNIILGVAGLADANSLNDSVQFAKKAIELVESGKPTAPIATKDSALAYLNYDLAKATMKTSPNDAIAYFVKAVKYESDLKKNAQIFNELAAAYGEGPVAKYTKDYEGVIGKSVDSPEYKLVIANLNQAIDRQIDAFARAAALSTNPADKKAVMDVLTGLYKDRMKTDAGLNELVASVLTKPVPDPPKPVTEVPAAPAPAPTSGGTGASSGPGSLAPGSSSAMKPAGTAPAKPAATGTPTNGTGAKPTSTPTPKPRSRRNH